MAITETIRSTLETHLSGTSSIPSIIEYLNVKTAKDATDEHVRTKLYITSRVPAVRGPNPQMRYQGLYVATVCVPVGKGSKSALDYVDTLLARFDGSTNIVGASLTISVERAEVGIPYEEGAFYCVPVEITWYVYST